jgi:eukaryotic-like serine/threonine-protein kinase
MSPTPTTPAATRAGVILGTAAYMSPEQAKGKPVDRRADIWAFGCLLFEMLCGHRPFKGDGVTEVIAAVIMSPVDLRDLPPAVPSRIRSLVRRCLEKDPRRRLRDIGEARFLIEETLSGVPEDAAAGAGAVGGAAGADAGSEVGGAARGLSRGMMLAVAGALALGATAAAGALILLRPRPPEPPVRRFMLPSSTPFRSSEQGRLLAISPDGQSIAYVDAGKMFVRRFSRLDPIPIPTHAEPIVIFWSPDSAFIGYATSGKLWKSPAGGGESTPIVDIPGSLTGGCGVSWGPDGRIVVSRGDGDLMRVPAQGGDFETILTLEKGKDSDFHDPEVLPDASGVLAVSHTQGGRPDTLFILVDKQRKTLLKIPGQDIWFPVYSPTGHILYRRHPINAGIWALPFSLKTHAVTGEPFLVASDGDLPSVSIDGTLVHSRGITSRVTQLVSVDRTGKVIATIGPRQEQWPFPELSPDGRRVAIAGKENEVDDIWIDDIERGTRTRLSAGTANHSTMAWSADGEHIYYSEGAGPPFSLNVKNADGSGQPKKLATGWGPALSADGDSLFYTVMNEETFYDLSYTDLKGDGKEIPLLKNPAFEAWGRPSPDGKYFAYASDESGNAEVYIKRFPSGEGKWQVSTTGGDWPRWNRKGTRLYYAQGDTIMEVDVTTQPALTLGKPRTVFTRKPLGWPLIFGWPPGFDVTAQEDRFVIVAPVEERADINGIVVQENWAGEFTRPAP